MQRSVSTWSRVPNSLRGADNGELPRAADLVDALGSQILEFVHRPVGGDPVHDLVLFDPEMPVVGRGEMIIGAGCTARLALDLIEQAAAARASGLILRAGIAHDHAVVERARECGVALVACRPELPWAQLVVLIRGALDRGRTVDAFRPSQNDLFELADAAATCIGAPVTIEDNKSRLVAYSTGQEGTDPARLATIVGRRVPPPVLAHYRARGVFRRLVGSASPFVVEEGPDGTRPRLVVPVHNRGQWLGAVWAVLEDPVMPVAVDDLGEVLVAISSRLLRLQSHVEVERREMEASLRDLLRDGRTPEPGRLGEGPWRVVRVFELSLVQGSSHRAAGQGVEDLCASVVMQARRGGWHRPLIGVVEDDVYAIVDAVSGGPGSWAWMASELALGAEKARLAFAAGGVCRVLENIPGSRVEADELAGLVSRGTASFVVSTFEEQWAPLFLARALGATGLENTPGPVRELYDHDQANGTDYVRTLEVWLSYQTDLRRAARQLHVHPNTIRHRMKRIAALVEVDLQDPEQVLAIRLQAQAYRTAVTAVMPSQFVQPGDGWTATEG
ncbi:PucR family transcriptional regulator [Streptomyces sp. NPDC002346]